MLSSYRRHLEKCQELGRRRPDFIKTRTLMPLQPKRSAESIFAQVCHMIGYYFHGWGINPIASALTLHSESGRREEEAQQALRTCRIQVSVKEQGR
jgi:hypothetical protein